ncbi:YigZ family protein [uncultured Tyzzerella sp.]|uniref:YigZ family protein n=1 Tax=uncultured Tyzzerella sp. TaxID=2321398 RepID=UPI002942547A|nr:YigZ family protein [uncultured Tyzzerella sp.]
MKKSFNTINQRAEAEIVEKKSRFIANVLPISSEQEAISFISEIKKQHYNARHNCFAYIIGGDIPIIRFSDDGEPNGTAGKPILDVLLGEKIENAIIVVTRYFGGTLLGTGGLVRAYGKSAKEGLMAGKIVQMDTYTKIFVVVDYSLIGKIQYEISTSEHILIDTEYTDLVKFSVYIKNELLDQFIENIINITNNSATITKENEYFLKLIDGKVVLD